MRALLFVLLTVVWVFGANGAKEKLKVNITKDIPYVDVDVWGVPIRIMRIQDTNHKLRNSYIRTSRPTPPFYIQRFQPIPGIETYGELETIKFIRDKLNNDEGLLIDARMPQWYRQGTIPGAMNVPFTMLAQKRYVDKVLSLFGAQKKNGKWDFSNALTILFFDNGPWCQQAVTAMKHLVALGYPKNKIKYYRGGMQYWQIVGLTVFNPVTHKEVKY